MQANRDFDTLYREQYPRVRRICLGYAGGDPDTAGDLVQEVFIRVWENLHKFRGDSQLSTWIYRIAVNTCLLEIRKRRRRKTVTSLEALREPVAEPDDETVPPAADRVRQLYAAIDGLTASNRTLALLVLEGLPQQEIASITGLSHGAVRTRVHRIKNDLLKRLTDETI